MGEKKIRLLKAEEIECRVDSVYDHGITLLLYKDARVDQNVLDETFGLCGWKREHTVLGDEVFCTVSIKDEKGEWVPKQDVGTRSYAEPVKGAASDSFKRACFNVGIGRELYTAPFIWIPADKVDIRTEKGKRKVKDRFKLTDIQYDESRRSITGVRIVNGRGEEVFSYGMNHVGKDKSKPKKESKETGAEEIITWNQEEELRRMMYRKNVSEEAICQRYLVPGIRNMDQKTYDRVMRALQATKDAA